VIKGFSFHGSGEVFVVSTRDLSGEEKSELIASLVALPDEYTQEYLVQNFDVLMFQTDLFGLLPALSNPDLRLEFGALNTFATNRDFAGMEQYLGFLMQIQVATQDDIDAVNALLTKQGIIYA
jgi:hypothetical protein